MSNKILLHSAFGDVTQSKIINALIKVGVSPGDILMVHSRLFSLGKIAQVKDRSEFLNFFIEALLEAVGKKGSLIFPTFTLSFCKTGVYDVQNSRSEMGILSEEVRKKPESKRILHPVYSVAVTGLAPDNLQKVNTKTCFGDNSIFDLLHKLSKEGTEIGKVKFLTIGIPVPPTAITYVHYLEEKMRVPYRYFKEFSGVMINNGERVLSRTTFFVRNLERKVKFNGDACWKLWQEKRIYDTQQLGDSFLCLIEESRLHNVTIDAIREKNDFLCVGGYDYPIENSS